MDKEGLLLVCSNFPCFTNIGEERLDYRLQTEARLVIVVAQHFNHALLVVPLTTAPGAYRIPINVAIPQMPWHPDVLTLTGDTEALSGASYVNLAQLTTFQWGCRMLNDVHLLMHPLPGKRARLPPNELHKLRSMLAIHMLKLGNLGGFGGLGSGYGGPGSGYGGPVGNVGLMLSMTSSSTNEEPTAPADMHNRALLAHDEDPFKLMLLSFGDPCATPEQMAAIVYADHSSKLPPSNL